MAASQTEIDIENFKINLSGNKNFIKENFAVTSGVTFSSRVNVVQYNMKVAVDIKKRTDPLSILELLYNNSQVSNDLINKTYITLFQDDDLSINDRVDELLTFKKYLDDIAVKLEDSLDYDAKMRRKYHTSKINYDKNEEYWYWFWKTTSSKLYESIEEKYLFALQENDSSYNNKFIAALKILYDYANTHKVIKESLPEKEYIPLDSILYDYKLLYNIVNKFSTRTLQEVKDLVLFSQQSDEYIERISPRASGYGLVVKDLIRLRGGFSSIAKGSIPEVSKPKPGIYNPTDTVGCDNIWTLNAYYDDIFMGSVYVFHSAQHITKKGKKYIVMEGILKNGLVDHFEQLYPTLRNFLPRLNDLLIPMVKSIAHTPGIDADYVLVRPLKLQGQLLIAKYGAKLLSDLDDEAYFPCHINHNIAPLPTFYMNV